MDNSIHAALIQVNPLLRALITEFLVNRGYVELATAFSMMDDTDAYATARVFSNEVNNIADILPCEREYHKVGLALLERMPSAKENLQNNIAFDFYCDLAYTNDRDDVGELDYLRKHWADMVEWFTPYVCASDLLEAGAITAGWNIISEMGMPPTGACGKCGACHRTGIGKKD